MPFVASIVIALGLSACAPAAPPLSAEGQVAQIVQFVETARGHEFVTTPDVEFLSDADFRAEVLASVVAAEPAVDQAEVAFAALGWIAPEDDLYAKYQIAFGGGVVGFYDPATKVLKVRGTDLTPYRREVIAHELTHALDDQIHDLGDLEEGPLLDEGNFASLVAVEGSASLVQQAYVASMSPLEQIQDLIEQLELGSDPELLTVPLALLSFTSATYLRGATFQNELVAALGNPAGPDQSLTRYPATAEQAYDTSKYLADEPAVVVATPPADGTVVTSGTWGQYLLSLLLDHGLTLDQLSAPTQGWAGDAHVTWTDGPQRCFRLDTRMDSDAQAATLHGALVDWASTATDAQVVDLDPTTVRLTSCV
ncbi:hypothetical protein BH10ACT3_BH10ACT3_22280 [soil metagenome]